MTTGRPFPDSRCHGCSHMKLNATKKGAVFIQCRHPELPKYRSQPVRQCREFTPA